MKCKYCDSELDASEKFCTNCGAINEAYNKPADGFLEKINDSEIISSGNINVTKSSFFKKQRPGVFNWGAFSMSAIWALGNKLYLIAFLGCIPGVNIILAFVAGFKGNEWAARNITYRDMEEFSKIQEPWNRAGFLVFAISLILGFLYAFIYVVVMELILS